MSSFQWQPALGVHAIVTRLAISPFARHNNRLRKRTFSHRLTIHLFPASLEGRASVQHPFEKLK